MTICTDHSSKGAGIIRKLNSAYLRWPQIEREVSLSKVGIANGMRLAPKAVKKGGAKFDRLYFCSAPEVVWKEGGR